MARRPENIGSNQFAHLFAGIPPGGILSVSAIQGNVGPNAVIIGATAIGMQINIDAGSRSAPREPLYGRASSQPMVVSAEEEGDVEVLLEEECSPKRTDSPPPSTSVRVDTSFRETFQPVRPSTPGPREEHFSFFGDGFVPYSNPALGAPTPATEAVPFVDSFDNDLIRDTLRHGAHNAKGRNDIEYCEKVGAIGAVPVFLQIRALTNTSGSIALNNEHYWAQGAEVMIIANAETRSSGAAAKVDPSIGEQVRAKLQALCKELDYKLTWLDQPVGRKKSELVIHWG